MRNSDAADDKMMEIKKEMNKNALDTKVKSINKKKFVKYKNLMGSTENEMLGTK